MNRWPGRENYGYSVELPVSVFVLIVVSATVAGVLMGAMLISRRDRGPLASYREALDQLRAAQAEAALAEDLRVEVSNLNEQFAGAMQRESVQATRAAIAIRALSDYRSHIDDVIGLETEVASLRVVASRVPRLERLLAELDPGVVDLRERTAQLAD